MEACLRNDSFRITNVPNSEKVSGEGLAPLATGDILRRYEGRGTVDLKFLHFQKESNRRIRW